MDASWSVLAAGNEPARSLATLRVERREVVAHVVLDAQRHVAALKAGDREVSEVLVDLRVGHHALVADALAAALAAAGRTISARTADVRGIAGSPEPVEVGVDGVQLAGPELPVPERRAAETA